MSEYYTYVFGIDYRVLQPPTTTYYTHSAVFAADSMYMNNGRGFSFLFVSMFFSINDLIVCYSYITYINLSYWCLKLMCLYPLSISLVSLEAEFSLLNKIMMQDLKSNLYAVAIWTSWCYLKHYCPWNGRLDTSKMQKLSRVLWGLLYHHIIYMMDPT